MKYSFSSEFRQEEYENCLNEIGSAIRRFASESSCPVKTIRSALHVGAVSTKKVCLDKL